MNSYDGGSEPPGEVYRAFMAFIVMVIVLMALAIPIMLVAKLVEVLG